MPPIQAHGSFPGQGMRRSYWHAVGLVAVAALSGAMRSNEKDKPVLCEAVFSPGGGCESRIVAALAEAKKTIRIQMYIFTSKRIGEAVAQAAQRGVAVELILDKSQEKMTYGPWRRLRRDGVKVYFDADHDTANNKVVIIDKHTVITGSYNFTKAAEEKNAENILIIRNDTDLVNAYLDNFNAHLKHARRAS